MLSIGSKTLPTKGIAYLFNLILKHLYIDIDTKHLLLKVIEHAKFYTSIIQQESDIILHARKSLFFSKNKPWEKKINKSLFDITMGIYDRAEICKLVDLYISSFLGKGYGIQHVGFYRDDGLACLCDISGPASNKTRKDMIWTFWLKITITTNLKTVNFLDVTFNLCTGKYQSFNKPNDTPTYINVNSNRPPNIIKALPNSISQRINNISSDKATFSNTAPS